MVKTKKPTSKPKMSFNERVKKVMHGEAETKQKIVNVFSDSNINNVGLDPTTNTASGLIQNNILDVLNIEQGTEQEQREGNKIEDCKLRVRGFVRSVQYNANTNTSEQPFEVHMVFFKEKQSIGNNTDQLKSLPDNLTGIVDGTIMNSLYPYNKDKFIIRKIKVFRLRPQWYAVNAPASLVNSQLSNAPIFHRFVETIDIHKTLKYNDGSNIPTNDWVGVALFVINGDGEVLADQVRATASMDAVLRYKDL